MSAVVAPDLRACSRARFVAQVPPSWDADDDAASLGSQRRLRKPGPPRRAPAGPIRRSASPRMSAVAMAPCSLVPQPTTRIGDPALAASRSSARQDRRRDEGCASRVKRRSASAGSAAIMSVITNGGPSRFDGMEDSSQGPGLQAAGHSDRRR